MKLPVDIGDLMRSSGRAREDREQPVRLAVFVDVEAPDELVDAIREALRPQTVNARLHVEVCAPGETLLIDRTADAVVALAGPGTTLNASLAAARELFVPTVALALGHGRDELSRRLEHPILDTLTAEDAEAIVHALGNWFVDRLEGKRLALAANFEFMRRAVAEEAVKKTSFQNGVIGLVAVIPGADMPIMTANQAKMVLQIAAAYGEPLGAERIKELTAVVGGGFVFRAIARQALAFIPGFGWAVKAGIGYTGTIAMGYAAINYFEEGGDVSGLAERIREARDHAIEAARSRSLRRGPAEPPIPAHAYVVADADLAGDITVADLVLAEGGPVPASDAGGDAAAQGAGAS